MALPKVNMVFDVGNVLKLAGAAAEVISETSFHLSRSEAT